MKRKISIGDRHEKLLVVGVSKNTQESPPQFGRNGSLYPCRHKLYFCQCDCGKMVEFSGSHFFQNNSCGCLLKERDRNLAEISRIYTRKPRGHSILLNFYAVMNQRMKLKGLTITLTIEEVEKLVKQNCYYCGSPPSHERGSHRNFGHGEILFNGIDRMDNKIGYTKENSVTCCKFCNRAKWSYPVEEFLKWIQRVKSFNSQPLVS